MTTNTLIKVFKDLNQNLKNNYIDKKDLTIKNSTKNGLSKLQIWNTKYNTQIVFKHGKIVYNFIYRYNDFFDFHKLKTDRSSWIRVKNDKLIFLAAQVIHKGNIIVNERSRI